MVSYIVSCLAYRLKDRLCYSPYVLSCFFSFLSFFFFFFFLFVYSTLFKVQTDDDSLRKYDNIDPYPAGKLQLCGLVWMPMQYPCIDVHATLLRRRLPGKFHVV